VRSIQILHTNDFHNHLSEDQGAAIRALRARCEADLLLDSGDAVSAGNIGVRPGGEPILTLMSSIGYDAMTMGNREFHVANGLLRHKIANANFPVLCANMRWKEDQGELLPVTASITKTTREGIRLSVFGLTVPMVTAKMGARMVSAFLFDNPLEAARRQIEKLRDKSDVLIALTHIGLRQDERLAESCPELDLVIGGHSHSVLNEPVIRCGVPILQAGWFGYYVGSVTLEFDELIPLSRPGK
jgi:2',3'-cyclic-nucleotide 2'-phosphodiesterase (5'-nucleotidase family)